MELFLIVLHILVCLLLVAVILIQPGKSPGMGGAFGGMSSSGNFGAKSPTTILSKITVVFAVGFMLTSLALAWLGVRDHAVIIGDDDEGGPAPERQVPAPDALPGDDPETGFMVPPAQETPPASEGAAVEAGPSPPEPVEQAAPLDPAD